MLQFFLWYLLISLLGLLTFPLAYFMLPKLTDRGYAFSRALGWLLWGYIFWLLGSLGVLPNDSGGQIFALLILVALSGAALRQVGWTNLKDWLRTQIGVILTIEILFLVAFGLWALVRAANPEIVGTEKPMELAFINSILRSPTLPPNDPWLSGYAISYYHFGFILVVMLARLTATAGSVAFNLGGALVFGLAAIGSYGLLYNLLASLQADRRLETDDGEMLPRLPSSVFSPLLAPFFIFIVSNLGGLLHLLRLGGVFWRTDESGQLTSPIWAWLDMGSFSQPPPAEPFPHWWWWQASRVVQDFDFNWVNKGDVIDEFPFFSFLLADLHPHVLAMPFAFLLFGLIFNFFVSDEQQNLPWFNLQISPLNFAFSAILIGSLGFLNTWDLPFYVALFAGAYALRSTFNPQPSTFITLAKDFFTFSLTLGLAAILLYLPFYLSFSSQAGGILPNLIYVTRGVYFWVMFIPFLIPLLVFGAYLWRKHGDRARLKYGMLTTLGLIVLLLLLSWLVAGIIAALHLFSVINPEAASATQLFLGSLAAPGWAAAIGEGLRRRLIAPGTWLTLGALLTFVLASLWPRRSDEDSPPIAPAHTFVLLLTLVAALLVLGPEFLFLRDMFGYRINTIFKFYFLAWLMWAMAAAYATAILWQQLPKKPRAAFRVVMLLVISLSLLYPAMGLWSKANKFNPPQWTLDGAAHIQNGAPDEAAAMAWLREAPLGVVAEAVGGSYSSFARMATHSGQPTVLGWEFHEIQWRGGTEEMGSRKGDIERLYCIPNWTEAKIILRQYNIRYVVVGERERFAYGAGSAPCPAGLSETKFALNLQNAFQQGDVTVYEYTTGE
ncbi:MAG: hypothetical protein HN413_03180 [Chloroflexi bacterium]|nr:hypothetical protein [Chloroflexota bacterium]